MNARTVAAILSIVFVASCALAPALMGETADRVTVTSGSFKEGSLMPSTHAFDRENLSPAIAWTGLPEGAMTIALICHDPDSPSGSWIHWAIFNIPATATGLPEGVPAVETFDDGAVQGVNDFKKIGYDGPYPPYGTHRYIFKVYALDSALDLEPGASSKQLLAAMKGHILAEGALVGRYKR